MQFELTPSMSTALLGGHQMRRLSPALSEKDIGSRGMSELSGERRLMWRSIDLSAEILTACAAPTSGPCRAIFWQILSSIRWWLHAGTWYRFAADGATVERISPQWKKKSNKILRLPIPILILRYRRYLRYSNFTAIVLWSCSYLYL